jgi:hypothetical protein
VIRAIVEFLRSWDKFLVDLIFALYQLEHMNPGNYLKPSISIHKMQCSYINKSKAKNQWEFIGALFLLDGNTGVELEIN